MRPGYDPIPGELVVFLEDYDPDMRAEDMDVDMINELCLFGIWQVVSVHGEGKDRARITPYDKLAKLVMSIRSHTYKNKVAMMSVPSYGMSNYVVADMIKQREHQALEAKNKLVLKRNEADLLRRVDAVMGRKD